MLQRKISLFLADMLLFLIIYENPEHAAIWITWNMCQDFIKKLNKMEGINKYRLPTEKVSMS